MCSSRFWCRLWWLPWIHVGPGLTFFKLERANCLSASSYSHAYTTHDYSEITRLISLFLAITMSFSQKYLPPSLKLVIVAEVPPLNYVLQLSSNAAAGLNTIFDQYLRLQASTLAATQSTTLIPFSIPILWVFCCSPVVSWLWFTGPKPRLPFPGPPTFHGMPWGTVSGMVLSTFLPHPHPTLPDFQSLPQSLLVLSGAFSLMVAGSTHQSFTLPSLSLCRHSLRWQRYLLWVVTSLMVMMSRT